ncbi:MAG: RDD family protein, partial [Candidatus Eiseniibacteriota bacterium]
MYCAHCGLALPEGAAFCPRCGTASAPAEVAEGGEAPHAAAAGALPVQGPGVVVPSIVPYAGFWRRLVAMCLDGLILTFVTFPFQWFMRAPVFGWMNADSLSADEMMTLLSASAAPIVLGWLCSWLYFSLLESSKLQGTLGKAALNIRVTDLEGRRISFGRATGR